MGGMAQGIDDLLLPGPLLGTFMGSSLPLNNLLGRGSQPHFITYEDIEAQTSVTHSTATQTDNW